MMVEWRYGLSDGLTFVSGASFTMASSMTEWIWSEEISPRRNSCSQNRLSVNEGWDTCSWTSSVIVQSKIKCMFQLSGLIWKWKSSMKVFYENSWQFQKRKLSEHTCWQAFFSFKNFWHSTDKFFDGCDGLCFSMFILFLGQFFRLSAQSGSDLNDEEWEYIERYH